MALLVVTEIQGYPHVIPQSNPGPYSTATSASRLTATGELIDTPLELGPRSTRAWDGVSFIASNGVDFLVSWRNPDISNVQLFVVRADLQVIALPERQQRVTGLTWAGTHYLVSEGDYQYLHVRRVAPDGSDSGEARRARASGIVEVNSSGRIVVLGVEDDGVVTYSNDDFDLVPAPPSRRRASRR